MVHRTNKYITVIVTFAMLLSNIAPAFATVPAYSNLNDSDIQKQTLTIIDNDITISNADGTGFGNGYIDFNISNSTVYDELNIQSSDSLNTEGAISVTGDNVYIGTGSDTVQMGTINSTFNGQDGRRLRIDFINDSASVGSLPVNNDFETGSTTGWTIDTSVSSVPDTPEIRAAMYETVDGNPSTTGDGYDLDNTGDSITQSAAIDNSDANQGSSSLRLQVGGSCWPGYGYVWGPSATSSSFSADAGDRILFDWKATQTSDWYVAYALLIDNQNSETTVLLAQQGTATQWATKEVVIPQTSNDLQFRFILGGYDNTGGTGVGSTMHIDNIRTMVVTDTAVSSLAQAITYNYTSTTLSGDVVTGRTLTITTQDSDSEISSSTATISVYGDSPSFNSAAEFSVSEGESSETAVLYDAQADNGDGGADDQDITYSITGGDGQALFNIDPDNGELRLNSLGISTLDYETKNTYSLQIQADDGQAVSNTATETVSVIVTDVNATLNLGNIENISCDWGRNFDINHSVNSDSDDANNVELLYNVSWIPAENYTVIEAGDTEWNNHTIYNNTAQVLTVLLEASSADASAIGDSETFVVNITRRDVNIISQPEASYSVNPRTLVWINASACGEYNETFIGKAVLTLDGIPVDSAKNVTDGNVSFNASRSSAGTYNFAIRFYNTSYYYNQSTNNTVVTVNSIKSGVRTSVSSGQPSDITTSTATSVKHVTGGAAVNFDFSAANEPVTCISFEAQDNEGLVVAKIQTLSRTPSDVPEPQGNTYSIMSINVGAEGTISEDNSDRLIIRFKVSKEWINEGNIDISSIRLSRYHEMQWNDLPTSKESEDDEYIYFYASTPGFSIFSIQGNELGSTSYQVPASSSVTEKTAETQTQEDEKQTGTIPGFCGVTALLFILIAVLFARKKIY